MVIYGRLTCLDADAKGDCRELTVPRRARRLLRRQSHSGPLAGPRMARFRHVRVVATTTQSPIALGIMAFSPWR
jgi:hypothetical protein